MTEQATEQSFQMPVPDSRHNLMKPFEGTFKSEVKMWMGPGDPMVSTGTLNCEFHLDGLFLHQDYVGHKTDGPFPSFEGKGYWGFNTTESRFEGFWIDNASSTMQLETGQVDETGKVWEMCSAVKCPQTGQEMKKRSVITLLDNDHNRIEMFFTGEDGIEMKAMEINYARA